MTKKAVFLVTDLIEDHGEDFDSLERDWNSLLESRKTSHVFSTALWGRTWWNCLGSGELHLLALRRENRLAGIAPLVRRGDCLTLLGDKEVCDYLDIVSAPGDEESILRAALGFARQHGWNLDLQPLLAGSPSVTLLGTLAGQAGYSIHTEPLDVSYMLDLPDSWESYLNVLPAKHRHELRRKMRRLASAGKAAFSTSHDTEDFLHLFRQQADKAAFLTPARETFFREMMRELWDKGWLKLYFLELDGKRVAGTLCFDYKDVMSLYNSGFDPLYSDLSVGLIAKAWSIRAAIEMGRRRFDLLRGAENYKAHLGGQPVEVYRCVLASLTGGSEPRGFGG